MADKDSTTRKAQAKVKEQISKSEQSRRIAEFEKQEARRIQGLQIAEEKAKQRSDLKKRKEDAHRKAVELKNAESIEQIKNGFSYAKRESFNVTINLSLLILFIVYLVVFHKT